MKIETTTYLWASEGMWLTDGVVYAKTIKLAEDRSADEFHEITDEEYNNIMAEVEAETEV